MAKFTLPYKFTPRVYQEPLGNYILKGGKRAFWCVHRRAGKDLTCWNLMIMEAARRTGNYLYMLPTREQAVKIIWQGKDQTGRSFMDYIPRPLIKRKREVEKLVELQNGSLIQLEGSADMDRVIGQGPAGVIFSEFSVQKRDAWDYISPMLEENQGWAIFNGTARPPSEARHFKDMFDMAKEHPDWFCELAVSCAHDKYNPGGKVPYTGVFTPEQIDEQEKTGLSEAFIRQEYFCDFYASSENILIPVDLLNAALDRDAIDSYAPMVAGIDVGHSLGGDPSAIVIRRGGRVLYAAEAKYRTLGEVAGWAGQKMRQFGCTWGAADGLGWGAGIGTIIGREFPGINVVEINVAESASYKDMFSRRRDELWWKTREFFTDNLASIPKSLPAARKLIDELSGVTYEFMAVTNKVKVQGKESMKKEGKKSPNLADALTFTFATEAQPATLYMDLPQPRYLVQ